MHGAVVVPQLAGEGGGVGGWVRLKLDVQRQGSGNILNVDVRVVMTSYIS